MKLRMSTLQRRISVALTAVVLLFIGVQGYLVYLSLERQEDELVDEVVMSEARRLIDRIAEGKEPTLIQQGVQRLGPNMTAWLVTPGHSTKPLPAWLRPLAPGPHMRHLDERVLHSVIQDTAAGRLYVEYDATENEAFVYEFGGFLLVTGVAFVILGWLLSVWLARIVVAPIGRLAQHLSNWSPSRTTPKVGTSDEETLLLQAFDRVQRRMDQAVAHEREFAANVRHEVRTPLAALRTDAELVLLTERALSTDSRQRLNRIISSADAVAEAVEAAHALASAAPTRREPVDLASCVDSAWASLQHLRGATQMQLRLDIDRGSQDGPVLDRQALMTVLRNLLRNAIVHAAPGICEVSRTAHGLTVSDNGPGIAPEILPRIFDRYFSGRLRDTGRAHDRNHHRSPDSSDDSGDGSNGSPGDDSAGDDDDAVDSQGLGLAIAEQIARQQQWQLSVRSTLGKGTTFVLDFE